jgi:hypothetical protein
VRNRRKGFRLPVLKELQHPSNIVLEALRKRVDVLVGEQRKEIRRLGRITPHELN